MKPEISKKTGYSYTKTLSCVFKCIFLICAFLFVGLINSNNKVEAWADFEACGDTNFVTCNVPADNGVATITIKNNPDYTMPEGGGYDNGRRLVRLKLNGGGTKVIEYVAFRQWGVDSDIYGDLGDKYADNYLSRCGATTTAYVEIWIHGSIYSNGTRLKSKFEKPSCGGSSPTWYLRLDEAYAVTEFKHINQRYTYAGVNVFGAYTGFIDDNKEVNIVDATTPGTSVSGTSTTVTSSGGWGYPKSYRDGGNSSYDWFYVPSRTISFSASTRDIDLYNMKFCLSSSTSNSGCTWYNSYSWTNSYGSYRWESQYYSFTLPSSASTGNITTMYYWVKDGGGRTSSRYTVKFVVDSSAPTIASISVSDGGTVSGTNIYMKKDATISVVLRDTGAGVLGDSYAYVLGTTMDDPVGDGYISISSSYSDYTNSYSDSVNQMTYSIKALTSGNHEFELKFEGVVDFVGNTSGVLEEYTVIIDNTPPTIESFDILDGDPSYNDVEPEVGFTDSTTVEFSTGAVLDSGGSGIKYHSVWSNSNGIYFESPATSINGELAELIDPEVGPIAIVYEVYDKAGNYTSIDGYIFYDINCPTLTSPYIGYDGSAYIDEETGYVYAKYGDVIGFDIIDDTPISINNDLNFISVYYTLDGTIDPVDAGYISITQQTYQVYNVVITTSTRFHMIEVYFGDAHDRAGNALKGTNTYTIIIDNGAPTVSTSTTGTSESDNVYLKGNQTFSVVLLDTISGVEDKGYIYVEPYYDSNGTRYNPVDEGWITISRTATTYSNAASASVPQVNYVITAGTEAIERRIGISITDYIDRAGNSVDEVVYWLYVDNVAPTISMSVNNGGTVIGTNIYMKTNDTLTIDIVDNMVGMPDAGVIHLPTLDDEENTAYSYGWISINRTNVDYTNIVSQIVNAIKYQIVALTSTDMTLTFRIQGASDKAGNTIETKTYNIIVDNTAPTLYMTDPATVEAASYPSKTRTVKLTYTEANSSIASAINSIKFILVDPGDSTNVTLTCTAATTATLDTTNCMVSLKATSAATQIVFTLTLAPTVTGKYYIRVVKDANLDIDYAGNALVGSSNIVDMTLNSETISTYQYGGVLIDLTAPTVSFENAGGGTSTGTGTSTVFYSKTGVSLTISITDNMYLSNYSNSGWFRYKWCTSTSTCSANWISLEKTRTQTEVSGVTTVPTSIGTHYLWIEGDAKDYAGNYLGNTNTTVAIESPSTTSVIRIFKFVTDNSSGRLNIGYTKVSDTYYAKPSSNNYIYYYDNASLRYYSSSYNYMYTWSTSSSSIAGVGNDVLLDFPTRNKNFVQGITTPSTQGTWYLMIYSSATTDAAGNSLTIPAAYTTASVPYFKFGVVTSNFIVNVYKFVIDGTAPQLTLTSGENTYLGSGGEITNLTAGDALTLGYTEAYGYSTSGYGIQYYISKTSDELDNAITDKLEGISTKTLNFGDSLTVMDYEEGYYLHFMFVSGTTGYKFRYDYAGNYVGNYRYKSGSKYYYIVTFHIVPTEKPADSEYKSAIESALGENNNYRFEDETDSCKTDNNCNIYQIQKSELKKEYMILTINNNDTTNINLKSIVDKLGLELVSAYSNSEVALQSYPHLDLIVKSTSENVYSIVSIIIFYNAPIITSSGNTGSSVTLEKGEELSNVGASFVSSDGSEVSVDTLITLDGVKVKKVDTNVVGRYNVIQVAKDARGRTTRVVKEVIVKEKEVKEEIVSKEELVEVKEEIKIAQEIKVENNEKVEEVRRVNRVDSNKVEMKIERKVRVNGYKKRKEVRKVNKEKFSFKLFSKYFFKVYDG